MAEDKPEVDSEDQVVAALNENDPRVFALKCFVNGDRKKTDKLTTSEARCFRHAARHLVRYLTETYELPD